jgi:hypothetical protein
MVVPMWESNTESGGSFMRLNTKNQSWAYSIGRLWSQVRAGSLSKVANGFFFQVEGSSPKAAEGSLFVPAEGSFFVPAECSLFISAQGSLSIPAEGSLISSLDASSGCSLNGLSVSLLTKKLSAFLRFTLLAWLVVASQFSLHAHGEQTDDAVIHSHLDRLHQMASQANFDAYFALYAPDAVFIGTDAGERWTIDEFKAYAEPYFSAGRGWTYQTIERHIMGEGAVRWFDELLWNEKLGPCRGSGVMEKVGDEWLVSHYVLSLAVPNQIAGEVGGQSIAIEKARRPQ